MKVGDRVILREKYRKDYLKGIRGPGTINDMIVSSTACQVTFDDGRILNLMRDWLEPYVDPPTGPKPYRQMIVLHHPNGEPVIVRTSSILYIYPHGGNYKFSGFNSELHMKGGECPLVKETTLEIATLLKEVYG